MNPQSALVAEPAADIATPGAVGPPTPHHAPSQQTPERLEARRTIGRAKELLIAERGMSEPEAYRWIQKSAMDRRLSMITVATRILDGSEPAPNSDPDGAEADSADADSADADTGTAGTTGAAADSAAGDHLGE